MKKRSYIIGAGFLIVFFFCCFFFWFNSTTIYIVRHAEKNLTIAHDPPLTDLGEDRAIDLANLLNSKRIGFIYSTDSLRTKSTARPLANMRGLPISIYLKNNTPVSYSALPRHDRKNILIVGHGETILLLFKDLGGSTTRTTITGTDFDNLLIITITRFLWFKWVSSQETTYGAPTS
jgi:broad specificity phosphatase PhoE